MEKAKNVRRAAKGNFTRTLNAGNMMIEAKHPVQEVREAHSQKSRPPTMIWLRNTKRTRCT